MSYIVKLIPKHKGSGYNIYILKPYKNEVKWSKARAIKEAKFAMKGRLWTGISARDAYNYKIIKQR